MRFGLVAVLFMALAMVAGCASVSRGASVYKYDGRTWLIIRETGFEYVDEDVEDITSTQRLAIINPNGTIRMVAKREVDSNGNVELTTHPEGNRLIGQNPIPKVLERGKFIRRLHHSDIVKTNSGGYEIRTSQLQEAPPEDQSSAPSNGTPEYENISTTLSGPGESGGD